MFLCLECLGVDTGTRLNLTEQEIVEMKRNFRLHSLYGRIATA